MLKGLFGLGRRPGSVTAHVPAGPAGAELPAAARGAPAPTLTRPVAGVSGREPGQLLGGVYPVLRHLGSGGFGEVFLCRHPAWNIEVAVKLPHEDTLKDPRTLPDLEREAEQWTGLGLHPNITYCYHLHPVGTPPWPLLVVEYVAGGTLRRRIESREAVSDLRGNLDLAIQLCHALEHAHGRRLVHRDLKPENVLLAEDGTVKLTDFGIALRGALGGAGGVAQSSVIGTPDYMAPEQACGEPIDARADLYALGACLYELFCFALPYSGRAATGRTPLPPTALRRDQALPEGLDALLPRLVSWEAAGRPASARAVREQLAAIYQAAYGEGSKYAELPELSLTASGHNNRGVSYHFLGKTDQAEAAFRDALTADPLHPEATFNLGLTEWRAAKITDAEFVRRQDAVRAAIGDWRALYLLSLVHSARQDFDEALGLLKEARQLVPGQNEVHEQLEYAKAALGENYKFPRILEGHTSGVRSVGFSSDGQLAISSSDDNTVRLWELSTGQSIFPVPAQEGLGTVVLHPNQMRAVVASKSGAMSLWDLAQGTCLLTFDANRAPVGRFENGGLAFNGLYTLCWGTERQLVLSDANSGRSVRNFVESGGEGKCAALSANSRLALTGGHWPHHVSLWDVRTGSLVRSFEQDPHILRGDRHGHGAEFVSTDPEGGGVLHCTNAVAFCLDDRHALSGGDDYMVRLWDVSSGRCVQKFRGHSDEVTSLAVSVDGRLVLSGGADASVRLWDISTGRCIRTFTGHERRVNAVSFSQDGSSVVSGSDDETVRIWPLPSPGPSLPPLQLAEPAPLADILAEAEARSHCLTRLQNALDARSADDALAALVALEELPGGVRYPQTVKARRQVEILCSKASVNSAWYTQSFDGHAFEVRAVTVSSDGELAMTAGGDHMVKIWDIASGSCMHTLMGHLSAVKAVAFNADASLALSGGFVDEIRLWDASTGQCLRTFQADDLSFEFQRVGGPVVSCLAFSPDGRRAISGENELVRVWDVSTGRRLQTFERHRIMVTTVAFSPDGTLALSGGADHALKLWDISAGHRLRTFVGHAGIVEAAQFDLTGRNAISCSADGTLKLWEISSGRCLRTFEGHEGPVKAISLSRDGRIIFSGGDDRTVRVWSIADGTSCFIIPMREKINDLSLADDDWSLLVAAGRSVIRYHLDWELQPKTNVAQ